MAKDPSSSSSASLTNLYTHLQTLIKKWVYDKSEVDNKLSNKLDKAQTSYKGKNVIVDSSSGNIAFEDKNNHTHSQYLTSHQDISEKEDKSNKVTSLDAFSTDTEYPSAKAVYDEIWTNLYGTIQNDYVPNNNLGEMAYHSYLSEIAGSNDIIDILQADGYSLFSGDYDDLDNKPTIPSASSVTPSADTTAGSVGNGTAWARSDHTHPKSSLYAESTHGHSDANITTLGFYNNLPQANYGNPSQQQVNSAINSAMGSKEDNANKVTSLSGLSTDTQYPSAKAVYNAIEDTFNLDTLDCINENFTILSLPQITLTYNKNSFESTPNILEGYDEGAYVDWGDGTPVETYELGDVLGHGYSDNVQEHTITIYGNILNLYDNSFKNYTGITSINIPSGVTSLGRSCFSGCTGLTSVTIPSSVTSLKNSCFAGCTGLTSITIPSSVTSLEKNCFYSCTGLTSVTIPSSVTSLENSCFSGCRSLTSVTIPNGVTSLGDNCFDDCRSLTNVTIPSSVTSLRHSCFLECTNLVDYQLYWETPPITWSSTLMPNNTDTYFTIPNGTTANYVEKSFPSDKLVERSE